MTAPIRAEIEASGPDGCPVALASADADGPISHVARSSVAPDGIVTEEFTVDDGASSLPADDFETVLEFDSHDVYRFEREHHQGCVCECVERYGCPVSEVHARDGRLYVSFYAADVETVQAVVVDLQDWFDGISLRQLTQSGERDERDFVFVDQGRLTDRQREVLETSAEMGYFDHPKGANAGEVAAELGISAATFREHLAAAQRKLFESLLEA